MNVLYLCDEYPPGPHGGIGTAVQLLARQMVREGHNVVVAGFYYLGYAGKDEFVDQGVQVFRFRTKLNVGFFNSRNSILVRAAVRLLKSAGIIQRDIENGLEKYRDFLEQLVSRYHIDVVEMPDWVDYGQYCNKAIPFPQLSVPVILKLHGSMSYFMNEAGIVVPAHIRKIDEQVLEAATAVTSVSNYTARKVAEYFKYTGLITTVYNGIDVTEPVKVNRSTGDVVFTGTLLPKKGIYELMKAWNIVVSKVPDARLTILGKGPVEKVKAELDTGAVPSVEFKGHVTRTELYRQLASACVAVFPSFAETFGLAPVEAMSCGTAVIYSTRTSGPEIIDNNVNGMLVDPANVTELAAAIIYLLEHTDVAAQFGERARQTVLDRFDIRKIVKDNLAVYASVRSELR